MSVRSSVRLSVPYHSTAAAACGGFAAERPARGHEISIDSCGRRRRCTALSSKCAQCRVYEAEHRLIRTREKLPSIEDRGQTDRVTTPTRAGLRRWRRSRHAARLAELARSLLVT